MTIYGTTDLITHGIEKKPFVSFEICAAIESPSGVKERKVRSKGSWLKLARKGMLVTRVTSIKSSSNSNGKLENETTTNPPTPPGFPSTNPH